MGGCVSAPKEKKSPVSVAAPKKSASKDGEDFEKSVNRPFFGNLLPTLIKIVLTGEGDAGKTTLCKTWAYGAASSTTPTVESDSYQKTFVSESGSGGVIDLWDTGGQERFRSITNSYYRAAEAVIVVFDQNYDFGRTTIVRWIEETQRYASPEVVVAVVANKKDAATTEELFTDIKKYDEVRGLNIGFFNISALNGEGVKELIDAVCERVIKTRELHPDCDLPWGTPLASDSTT